MTCVLVRISYTQCMAVVHWRQPLPCSPQTLAAAIETEQSESQLDDSPLLLSTPELPTPQSAVDECVVHW